MLKTLKLYYLDGEVWILWDCKYIEVTDDGFLVPHDENGNIIDYYYIGQLEKYKIVEQKDDFIGY